MASSVFCFKDFSVRQDKSSMKVGTDGVLLGAWTDPMRSDGGGLIGIKKILDIGTGTGLIAMIIAQKLCSRPEERAHAFCIDAIDIDESSCIQAKENVAKSKFKEKISVLNKPLSKFQVQSECNCYDLIVSNPPYFNKSLKSKVNLRNIVRHSDASELNSEKLLYSVLKLLKRNGKFCLILPKNVGETFIEKAKKENLYCTKITKVFPKPGKECLRLLMQFEFSGTDLIENSITIETGKFPNDFSEEYKLLTKDLYLAF